MGKAEGIELTYPRLELDRLPRRLVQRDLVAQPGKSEGEMDVDLREGHGAVSGGHAGIAPPPSDAERSRPERTWTTWREALALVAYRPHLRRTLAIAMVVGTVLFAINQLDVVLHGGAGAGVALKIALTYCVPFIVSNLGILVATRRRPVDA